MPNKSLSLLCTLTVDSLKPKENLFLLKFFQNGELIDTKHILADEEAEELIFCDLCDKSNNLHDLTIKCQVKAGQLTLSLLDDNEQYQLNKIPGKNRFAINII